ncbi:MAG: hypothetical protein LBL49_05540 [Clostridiales Family XIII bacterium]|jgi:putative spermidine/putrescine transport system permease protein|nr:hypothetical protein [Clostridiales Family XIII bacterium]
MKLNLFRRGDSRRSTEDAYPNPAEKLKPQPMPYILLAPFTLLLALIPIGFLAWAIHGFSNYAYHIPYERLLINIEIFNSRIDGFSNFASGLALSLCVALLSTCVAIITVRALNFHDFKGKMYFLKFARIRFMFPAAFIAIGIHALFELYGMGSAAAPLIVLHLIFALPFSLSIIKNCFNADSLLLEEHARVLGATSRSAFFIVSLPLILPGLAASFAVSFLLSMTQYLLETVRLGELVGDFTIIGLPLIRGSEITVYFYVYILPALLMLVIFQTIMYTLSGTRGRQ